MYYIYVLYSRVRKDFYVGITKDLQRRIKEHENGQTYSTKRYADMEFIYYEGFVCEDDARRREGYLKTTKGKKGLRLILRKSIE